MKNCKRVLVINPKLFVSVGVFATSERLFQRLLLSLQVFHLFRNDSPTPRYSTEIFRSKFVQIFSIYLKTFGFDVEVDVVSKDLENCAARPQFCLFLHLLKNFLMSLDVLSLVTFALHKFRSERGGKRGRYLIRLLDKKNNICIDR